MKKKLSIPIAKPYFTESEAKEVAKVLKSGWVVQGPKVRELERLFAEYVGTKYARATTSCTTALHLSLLAAGIGMGDEVICPAFTFIATPNSIMQAGATPVFAEVEEGTLNIDARDIEKRITKKTKAIMIVDQAGLSADYRAIRKIAKKHKLILIADSACGLGSTHKNQRVGSIADISCFSFHPKKLLSCGEGGIVTTNNKEYIRNVEILRDHGASVSDFERHASGKLIDEQYVVLGYNFRLTDIQAAVAVEQMKKLDYILKKRQEIAGRYNKALGKIPFLNPTFVPSYATHTYQSYIAILTKDSPVDRESLMNKLMMRGIVTRKGIHPAHLEPFYRKMYPKLSLPVTESLGNRIICLPIYTQMTSIEQDYVINEINQIFDA